MPRRKTTTPPPGTFDIRRIGSETKAPREKETPEQRFRRIATLRMNNLLRDFAVLGNLGSPAYRAKPDDLHQMEQQIDEAKRQAFERLRGQYRGRGFTFQAA